MINQKKEIEKQLRIWKGNMYSINGKPLVRYCLYRLFLGYKEAIKLPYCLEWEDNLRKNGFIDIRTKRAYFKIPCIISGKEHLSKRSHKKRIKK